MRLILILAALAAPSCASAQALYGKASAFRAQSETFVHAAVEAMVAERCGLRSDDWRVSVGHGAQARIDRLAAAAWPAGGPSRQTALIQVSQDMNDALETALNTMTTDDCETLRSDPSEMRALDALAGGRP